MMGDVVRLTLTSEQIENQNTGKTSSIYEANILGEAED